MKKSRLNGVGVVDLCDASLLRGASWGPDNFIVFSTVTAPGLMKLSADGGTPEVLTQIDSERGELLHYWPRILPEGKTVIFSIVASGNFDDSKIVAQSLATGERHFLFNASFARYVPTGHLIYARGNTLYAVPFDADRLEVRGSRIPAQLGLDTRPGGPGRANLAVSETGTLVYVARDPTERRMVVVDLEGNVESLPIPTQPFMRVRVSPDGRRLAFSIENGRDNLFDIYLYELAQGRTTRLVPPFKDPSHHFLCDGIEWSPDNQSLAVNATAPASWRNIFLIQADGSGTAEALTVGLGYQYPDDWSLDGKRLIYTDDTEDTLLDIWELVIQSKGQPRRLTPSPRYQAQPVFSPDERWLAYTSDESGQAEIYVMPYERHGVRYQASLDGGLSAVWAPNGREIYYRKDDRMMAVQVIGGETLTFGKPSMMFEGRYKSEVLDYPRSYDLAPDGKRFVMIQREEQFAASQINVVLNWFEELNRLVPTNN